MSPISTKIHPGGVKTLFADAVHELENLIVKRGAAGNTVALCGASDAPLGICLEKPDQVGQEVAVAHFGAAMDTTRTVVASAATAIDDIIVCAAGGKVQKLPTTGGTYTQIGKGLEAALGDGDEFEIMPVEPKSIVVQ